MKQLTHGSLGGLPVIKVTERPPRFNILLYGQPGVGKTVFAGSSDSVPELRPVLLIDIEGGTNSLRNSYPNVATIRVTGWEELVGVMNAIADGDHEFETVIIDSLSEVQKINMYYNMRKAGKNPMEEKADWDDWGRSLEAMRQFTRSVRDLPYNTIMTCLVEDKKDQKTGKSSKWPYFTGKFQTEVAALPDEVFYMYMTEQWDEEQEDNVPVRALLTSATESVIAKDRSGTLDQVIVNPTMSLLYNTMYNNEKKEN